MFRRPGVDQPKTVPFIVQVARVRGATQTVPSPSPPGALAWDSPGQVSVLPSICPALVFIFGQPRVPCPGRILDAYLPLAPVAH